VRLSVYNAGYDATQWASKPTAVCCRFLPQQLRSLMMCMQVAMQMGAPVRKKDPVATSPYGTPKGARSPLSRY
jgi:hypothetical protein